jgi:hypothetical protein
MILDADAPDAVGIVLLEPSSADARRVLAEVRARRPDMYVVCASIYPLEDAAAVEPDAFLPNRSRSRRSKRAPLRDLGQRRASARAARALALSRQAGSAACGVDVLVESSLRETGVADQW